jgi:hypothetical protein
VPTRHGELLRKKIRFAAPLLHASTERFWEHPELARLYPRFLVAIHASVRATVPLMLAAVGELRRRASDVELNEPLARYFEEHAVEEAGHEAWLLEDLETLGIDAASVRCEPGLPPVAAMVGAQYYWIHHAHPVALLGMFAVLEGHPPTLAALDEAQRRTGLPVEGFRMLRRHAELDVAHGDELFDLIDRLPLADGHAALLGTSAVHTLGALGEMFDSLVSSHRPAPSDAPVARGA